MSLPTKMDQRHKFQAEHNEKLLQEGCFKICSKAPKVKYADWTITIAFYAALHYIHAFLSQNHFRTHFKNHRDRNDYLKLHVSVFDRRMNKVLSKYLSLYKLCRRCRYIPCYFPYVRPSDVQGYLNYAIIDLPKELGI